MLSHWFKTNNSGRLSGPVFDALIKTLTQPGINTHDLVGFSYRKMKGILAGMDSDAETGGAHWKKEAVITIPLPRHKKSGELHSNQSIQIPGLQYRSIVSVIREVYTTAENIYFHPFELSHKTPRSESPEERIYGEIYNSPILIEEYKRLLQEPRSEYEHIIVPLMFWSDATQLTQFSQAKAWPIYMFFGSQSKYLRGKPSKCLCHHIAYLPSVSHGLYHTILQHLRFIFAKLPDSIQDEIRTLSGGQSAPRELLTHIKRELIHEIWKLLLDDEFIDMYQNGILIKCADGLTR
jgi:hypothetical protein